MTVKEIKEVEEVLFHVYEKGLQQLDCDITEACYDIEDILTFKK